MILNNLISVIAQQTELLAGALGGEAKLAGLFEGF
jgi:hypothetical protein